MKTIRYNSFETNSSSTHAIVVPKQIDENRWDLFDSLDHNYCFDRDESKLITCWDEKLAYSYMVLRSRIKDHNLSVQDDDEYYDDDEYHEEYYEVSKKEIKKFKDDVNRAYKEVWGCEEIKKYKGSPDFIPDNVFFYLENVNNSYVDHVFDFDDETFVKRLLTDYNFLKRFIFSEDSYITIGSDEERGYNIKTIGFEYDYEECYYVNEKGERPPKEWFKDKGGIKDEYWQRYNDEYTVLAGGFWDKLKEYKKDNDVYLKGN